MKKHLAKLAHKAGFVIWSDESWGPGKGRIDWSSNYSQEYENLVQLVVKSCIKECKTGLSAEQISSRIAKKFKI